MANPNHAFQQPRQFDADINAPAGAELASATSAPGQAGPGGEEGHVDAGEARLLQGLNHDWRAAEASPIDMDAVNMASLTAVADV